MTTPSLPYLIKSIPFLSKEGFEFELYAFVDKALGAKVSERVDIIYADSSRKDAQGFILVTERETGEFVDVGSSENPLPMELLQQMRRHRGLAFYEVNAKREVQSAYTLHV